MINLFIPGKSKDFGLVKSSVLKVVKTLTDVEWLDLEELEEKEKIEMCEAEKRWLEVKSNEWKGRIEEAMVDLFLQTCRKVLDNVMFFRTFAFSFSYD